MASKIMRGAYSKLLGLFLARAFVRLNAPAALTAASDQTYTAAHLLSGMLLRDPNGGARGDTLPDAADLVGAIAGAAAGASFEFILRNTADENETITVAAGTGGAIDGTATVEQGYTRRWLIRLTNVTPGAEAYTAYSLGAAAH